MGIKTSYKDVLSITIKQILLLLDKLPEPEPLIFHFKDGLDGSGSHSIYNQVGNKHTNNMILYMFTSLKLTTGDGHVMWSEQSPCFSTCNKTSHDFLRQGNIRECENSYEYTKRKTKYRTFLCSYL